MGSLTSRPSIPRVRQPVFVAAPPPSRYVAPPPPVQVAPPSRYVAPPPLPTSGTSTPEGSKSEEKQAAERRESSLLKRKRGRLSTILTSFRGTLSDTSSNDADTNKPKTLLGE